MESPFALTRFHAVPSATWPCPSLISPRATYAAAGSPRWFAAVAGSQCCGVATSIAICSKAMQSSGRPPSTASRTCCGPAEARDGLSGDARQGQHPQRAEPGLACMAATPATSLPTPPGCMRPLPTALEKRPAPGAQNGCALWALGERGKGQAKGGENHDMTPRAAARAAAFKPHLTA